MARKSYWMFSSVTSNLPFSENYWIVYIKRHCLLITLDTISTPGVICYCWIALATQQTNQQQKISNTTFFLNITFTPKVRLELTTFRSRVRCSTNWPNQEPQCTFLLWYMNTCSSLSMWCYKSMLSRNHIIYTCNDFFLNNIHFRENIVRIIMWL